jgi:predicted transcriptional regulator
MPTVSVRLPDDEQAKLDETADLLGQDRSTTMRTALREGLEAMRTRESVARYQSGDASVAEAARVADLSVAEWIDVAAERNCTLQLRASDLADDADVAEDL